MDAECSKIRSGAGFVRVSGRLTVTGRSPPAVKLWAACAGEMRAQVSAITESIRDFIVLSSWFLGSLSLYLLNLVTSCARGLFINHPN